MKLPPRNRTVAKLYEMEPESRYLLLFKNKDNAHLYGSKKKSSGAKKSKKVSSKIKSPKTAKKTSGVKASKKATAPTMTNQQVEAALTNAREGSLTHRWEFADDGGGWSPYDLEASKLVEMEYQSWLQQPEVFVRSVQSGYFHYSVNFNKMEQTNIKHQAHRVRKIRRVALVSPKKDAEQPAVARTPVSTAALSQPSESLDFSSGAEKITEDNLVKCTDYVWEQQNAFGVWNPILAPQGLADVLETVYTKNFFMKDSLLGRTHSDKKVGVYVREFAFTKYTIDFNKNTLTRVFGASNEIVRNIRRVKKARATREA